MKKLLSLLLAAVLLAGCAPTYDGPTETRWVITESVTEQHSSVTGFIQEERTLYAYDLYGNLVQTLEYFNGKKTIKTVYAYDNQGNLLTETEYAVAGLFPRRNWQRTYTYDDRGRLLSDSSDIGSHYLYTYDDATGQRTTTVDGTLTEEAQLAPDGTLLWKKEFDRSGWVRTEYTRDRDGKVLAEQVTDSTGARYEVYFERDSHGEYIRSWRVENGVETELYRQEYEYDDRGRMVRLFKIEDGVRRESSRREYLDDYGSYTTYREGKPSHTVIYDEYGHEIERLHYFDDSGQVGIRQETTWSAIQVPAKEEEAP